MDLNRVTIDENAIIHYDMERQAPKLGQDLYILSENGDITKNLITKVEKAWTVFLFGGRGGIYVYTYTTPNGETLKKVYDGTMFKSEARAIVARIERFQSRIQSHTHEIEELSRTISLDVDKLAELADFAEWRTV